MNFQIPPGTQALILGNVAVYFLMLLFGSGPLVFYTEPFSWLALWPLGIEDPRIGFAPWQLVSYGFLHAGIGHLFFNMFALFMFGGDLERLFGTRWFLAYYFVCVITAAIAQLLVAGITNAPPYPTVGASGGVFGILLGFAMYFPRRTLVLVFPPIPLPAWLFVTLYGLLELYLGVARSGSGVAHFAHLGGMVGGYLMIMHRRGRRRR